MTDEMHAKIKALRDLRYVQEAADLTGLSEGLAENSEFKSLCLELAEEAVEREHQAEAIEARIKELQERKGRVLRTAETLRDIVLQCMDIRGEKSIQSPTLTLTAAHRPPDVIITDEASIPSRFFVEQPPKIDKKALKAAVLDDGELIDGTTLGNGKISLTIRRK